MILILLLLTPLVLGIRIECPSGTLTGQEQTSRNGRIYYAFAGIPYAKPPVGELRLKNPVQYGAWSGVLNATRTQSKCFQKNYFGPPDSYTGKEDCLYLNIYAPKNANNLPIMIYIHGGAFVMGSPGTIHAADFFMDENIVFVSMAYRLGPLGFLSFEDKIIPGNFALKDQAMAIQWVKNNIKSFGGDSNKITLFGESAGGASTNFHLFSPLTKDLIKGVISQSGTVNNLWSIGLPGDMKNRALKLASNVKCQNANMNNVLKCFQKLELSELYSGMSQDLIELLTIKPVIEKESPGAFITQHPSSIVSKTPWVAGFTSGERKLFTPGLRLLPEKDLDFIKQNLNTIIADKIKDLKWNKTVTDKEISRIRNYYFHKNASIDFIEQLGYLYEDTFFVFSALHSIQKYEGLKYLYHFEYKDPGHAEAIHYMLNRGSSMTKDDVQMSKKLVKFWAYFAKYQSMPELQWPHYDNKTKKFLRLNKTISVGLGASEWTTIYKMWNSML